MHLPDVKSTRELEALAVVLERRAGERFRLMAESMAARGRAELHSLFAWLQREEARHEAAIRETTPDLETALFEAHWPAKLGEAPHAADANQLANASVYDCLAEAVRNEVKAFRFFSYLAANANDSGLRARAEALAKEELAHAALLRRARRAAYRKEKHRPRGWPRTGKLNSLDDLRAIAEPREAILRQRIATLQLANARAEALERTGLRIQERLSGAPTSPTARQDIVRPAPSAMSLETEAAEAFDYYNKVADEATEEDLMWTAQQLAELALARIKLLADPDL